MLAEADKHIRPLVNNRLTVPDSGLCFSAACFAGKHWTLSKLREPQDANNNPTFAEEVGGALRGLGARRAYAPSPVEFNAVVIKPERLLFPIVLPYGVVMYRNIAALADGTFLRRAGDAGVFSAGGCGVLAVAYLRHLFFAHAGRECLLDREWVKSEGAHRSRAIPSVVDSILDALVELGPLDTTLVHAWPLYFIKPVEFVHHAADKDPQHAEYNRAAIRFLPKQFGAECGAVTADSIKIDLPRIARQQLLRRHIPSANIHMEHCYLADELPTTRNSENGRYLVAIVRH
jgi:hypothetical protein